MNQPQTPSPSIPAQRKLPAIVHFIPTMGAGGAERQLVTLLSQPVMRRYRHTVVLKDVKDVGVQSPENFFVPALRAAGADVIGLGLPHSRNWPRATLRVARLLRERGSALLHTHLISANVVGRTAGFLAGAPVVSTIHSADYDAALVGTFSGPRWKHDIARRIDGFTARHLTDQTIAVSAHVANEVQRKLGVRRDRTRVVFNSVPSVPPPAETPRAASKLTREFPWLAESRMILFVGRVCEGKDVLTLVEAFSMAAAADASLHLAIVGTLTDTAYVARVRKLADVSGLSERIHLLGVRSDVGEWCRSAEIFVFPTRFEGMPIALAEALSSGTPCIASNVGPMPELIEDGVNGLLVPVADPNALRAALERLISDEPLRLRLGRAARERALGEFDPVKHAHAVAEIYDRLLAL